MRVGGEVQWGAQSAAIITEANILRMRFLNEVVKCLCWDPATSLYFLYHFWVVCPD